MGCAAGTGRVRPIGDFPQRSKAARRACGRGRACQWYGLCREQNVRLPVPHNENLSMIALREEGFEAPRCSALKELSRRASLPSFVVGIEAIPIIKD